MENVWPSNALFNSTKQAVCVELRTGVTVAGILEKCDGWMNLVLHKATRYSADGEQEWKSEEVLIRGNAIKTIRVSPTAVRVREQRPHPAAAHNHHHHQPQYGGGGGGAAAGARRQRDEQQQGPRPKMSFEDRNKKFGKPRGKR